MKLLEEIIDGLSDEQPNLEHVLTKTKVLLYQIGQKDLASWVNSELTGYSGNDVVPEYRQIPTRVLVTATNGYTARWQNMPVPLGHLDKEMRDSLTTTTVAHSIANLQDWANSKDGALSKPLPAEFCGLLGKGLDDTIYVETAHVEIGRSQIVGILAEIKSRLLDFVLELSSQIPAGAGEVEATEVSKRIDTANLFNNAIFGDQTTIIVGDHNVQTVTNTVRANDFGSLAEYLKANKVPEQDISALEQAINVDATASSEMQAPGQYGSAVQQWLKEMLGKAVDTAWAVEINVAGSLLATALNAYYGLI